MVEDSIVAYGVTTGVRIMFAIVCFTLCSKGHSDDSHNHDYDKITTDDEHVHHN